MLAELRVENLLLIERAELRLDPGLNVITGETGAGKTLLAQALDLLLGGKPRRGILRPGAGEAYVEGVFTDLPPLAADAGLGDLAERLPLDDDDLVVARRVTAEGRTRAYLQGRSVSASDLRAVASRLLSFYGQHEHRKLTLASAQLEVLDAYCGEAHLRKRAGFERLWAETVRTERELTELREREGARERDLDLLEFELHEIEQAAPGDREDTELEAERARLAGVETLRAAAWTALDALEPSSSDADGATRALARAAAGLGEAEALDQCLAGLAERCRALGYEAEDLARELRDYQESLEADPARLADVDERLDLLGRLKRKHGGSIATVMEHARRCRDERERLANAGDAADRLECRLEDGLRALECAADELRRTRSAAAPRLEKAVRKELAALAMPDASFEISLARRSSAAEGAIERFGPRGADAVEFVLAPNRGVPPGPLKEIASGGELSRVMLALMTIASGSGGALVFDEVDAGVGGNTARAVGAKLHDLAAGQQVICITHLPQVASFADRHFRVDKLPGRGTVAARAEVEHLERDALVAELCRMLGSDAGDRVARAHAERMLQAA